MSQDHNHLNHATWQKGKSLDLDCAECGRKLRNFLGHKSWRGDTSSRRSGGTGGRAYIRIRKQQTSSWISCN
jgi:hypothetical protein